MRQPVMTNGFDTACGDGLPDTTRALIDRRARVLGQPYRLFYQDPVHVVSASGVRLTGADGQTWLDAYNNVPSVGHCHPHVVEAIATQAARLSTHTRYLDEGIIAFAERFLPLFPGMDGRLVMTCSGSEANDLAFRLARDHSGGTGFIITANAYHGVTHVTAGLSPSLGEGVPMLEHVRTISAPDPRLCGGPEHLDAFMEEQVRAAIHDMRRHGIRPAGMILDTILSSDGVFADPPGWLRGAVEAIRAAGGLWIADEVQAGFGRMGSHMWGWQRHGVIPDIVTMGKPMGNGYPVAGLVARSDILGGFAESARYFNTFGGNPVACAAASAVLDVIEGEKLMHNARITGARMKAGFTMLSRRYPLIGEVRGAGLFLGVDIIDPRDGSPDPATASWLVNELRLRRVLISAAGPLGHVLKIRPPLPFTTTDCDELLAVCEAALEVRPQN